MESEGRLLQALIERRHEMACLQDLRRSKLPDAQLSLLPVPLSQSKLDSPRREGFGHIDAFSPMR